MIAMTILEATVAPEKWNVLEEAYQAGGAGELPPGLAQSFLIHGASDPAAWQIVTLWDSREALDRMRNSRQTPGGVLMFRAAGAEPMLSVFDVAAHLSAS